MLLINSQVNLKPSWSANYITDIAIFVTTFSIADTKPYVSLENLSIQENTKLRQKIVRP